MCASAYFHTFYLALVTFYPDVLMNRHRDGRGLDKKMYRAAAPTYYNMHARTRRTKNHTPRAAYINPFVAFFTLSALSIMHIQIRTRSHNFWAYQYLFESRKGDIGRREYACVCGTSRL
jgi:hypothetical protein